MQEVELLPMAMKAAGLLFEWERLMFLFTGVIMGLILGVIPGLGGLVGLALLLPFTYHMDPYSAIALMLGLGSVTVTSDTIPAVLFGVPGTVGSAATILDGHPMAKNGEAGRAFGAAFTSSVLGGVFGACLLAVSIPILQPLMLKMGTPELLAICIFGLSLVAVLSGGTPFKGLAGVCIGLLVATAGEDAQTSTHRWTFDLLYLWEGLPVVPFALGLFAIPELADMMIARMKIAGNNKIEKSWSQVQGVKDAFANWWLILRCSFIGSALGSIPGIGASIIDWIAYGHAAQTVKGADQTFGKGDVRGVIASESSNNAKEGGALVPTIAFGVPGSASMALFLGAFLIHGITPGPKMLAEQLDITYLMVWSVGLANILGAGLCFAFTGVLAKIAQVRITVLVPVVLAITFVGAFQGSRDWGDIHALLLFGCIGWTMKRMKWPRPPAILGFVLGHLIENYMFISVNRYGFEWLSKPIVATMLVLTLVSIAIPMYRTFKRKNDEVGEPKGFGFYKKNINGDFWFTSLVAIMFIYVLWESSQWEMLGAKLVPQTVGWGALFFSVFMIISSLFFNAGEMQRPKTVVSHDEKKVAHYDLTTDLSHLEKPVLRRRVLGYFGWCLAFIGIAHVIGILPSMFVLVLGLMRFEGRESWKMTLIVSSSLFAFAYSLFHLLLHIPWAPALLGDWFPVLRTMSYFKLV